MNYDPYSVVVVPFPFTDKPVLKKRPALILSCRKHQEQTQHATLLMITSAEHSSWPSDFIITDLDKTGLKAKSIIRQKIFTIDLRLILKSIGTLSSRDKKLTIAKLQEHFPALEPNLKR